jgi:aryl-phospho-beta-D-glucosidase BglC (GH1 family)
VYINAWSAVKKLVARFREWRIGVLLDFHALPGGANEEAHSGTQSGKAGLWGVKKNLELAGKCLRFMAEEVAGGGVEGVVGIQVCNEAEWNAEALYQFYDKAIARIAEVDPSLPVYISDAWDLGRAMRYAIGKNSIEGEGSNPVVVDTHRYYTFAETDRERSPKEIIKQIPRELNEVSGSSGNVFERKGWCTSGREMLGTLAD